MAVEIKIHNNNMKDLLAPALASLSSQPGMYVQGQNLSRILDTSSSLSVSLLNNLQIKAEMSEAADWKIKMGKKWVQVRPDQEIVGLVASAGIYPGLREISGVTRTPFVRKDGSICVINGYDPATQIYLSNKSSLPNIPQAPSLLEIEQAKKDICEVVEDFPFETEEHKSVFFASVLSPLLRPAFTGSIPLFLFTAPTPGTGKSLLAQLSHILSTGEQFAGKIFPADPDEQMKSLTTFILKGNLVSVFDNVSGTLGGDALTAAITSPYWETRLMGGNKTTGKIPMVTTWLVTGNNVTLDGDGIIRRTMQCNIVSDVKRPETRDAWHHPNIDEWVMIERPRILAAFLTLVRAYFAAGSPTQNLKNLGGFSGWTLVRNILVFNGFKDPVETQKALMTKSDDMGNMLEAFISVFGKDGGARSASQWIEQTTLSGNAELKLILDEYVKIGKDGKLDSKSLTNLLKKFEGRVSETGAKLVCDFNKHLNVKTWSVVRAGQKENIIQFPKPTIVEYKDEM